MSTNTVTAPPAEATLSRRGFFMKLGILFNGFAAIVVALPIARFLFSSITAWSREWLSFVGAPRRCQQLSRGRDADGYFSQSPGHANRWKDRRHGVLGAPHRGRSISGVCHQLRTSRLPRPLVPPIRSVHVSVSRRRILPRWLACVWTTRTRALRISVQNRKRCAHD